MGDLKGPYKTGQIPEATWLTDSCSTVNHQQYEGENLNGTNKQHQRDHRQERDHGD